MNPRFPILPFLVLHIAVSFNAMASDLAPAPESDPAASDLMNEGAADFFATLGSLVTIQQGRRIFRFDTFGNEAFWSDSLRLHEAILGSELSGVGPGLDPATALAIGLKVDSQALPPSVVRALSRGQVDLADPATTVDLLRLDAVVGVKGTFENGDLSAVGITCALCHSTVDDSLAPGIGNRLDGWANRDLDPGAIIALAPNVQPLVDLLRLAHPTIDEATVRSVLRSWGPGRFDAGLLMDGRAFRPDGKSAATLIPPAFGLAGINLHTWTGWGGVAHWNAFVATLEMGGQGTFVDPRLDDEEKFPIAARAGFSHVRSTPDLVTAKLPALHLYQLTLEAPSPPSGTFDPEAAARGESVFNGKARCAECHVPPIFTEPGFNLHRAAEIGIDEFQAMRSPEEGYRTAPLKGLWTHRKGGFYHDGRFPSLADVIDHYDRLFDLDLSTREASDLTEYLNSL